MTMPRTNQPAKIFLDLMHPDDEHGEVSRHRIYDDDAVYIRADLAEELARALEYALDIKDPDPVIMQALASYNAIRY